MSPKEICVLGAGVVGLTTAIRVQEAYPTGTRVTIVAAELHTDPMSIRYTSLWAGANHMSFADGDATQTKLDKETFDVLWEMSAPGSESEECFLRITHRTYSSKEALPHPLTWMPDHRILKGADLDALPGSLSGEEYSTLTIDTPKYLAYLSNRFRRNGGTFIKARVHHVRDIIEGGYGLYTPDLVDRPHPSAVIVCAGLGARSLGGVEDQAMYPVRGQTLVIRAPWVKFGRSMELAGTSPTYIIPRRNGDIVVGGTMHANDYYPVPRPEISEDILRRGFELAPELAPPGTENPTIESVRPLIRYEGCGLRPARKGGIRFEVEWVTEIAGRGDEKVPLVHQYGHASYGYQSSCGSSTIALELLSEALGLRKS